MDPDIGLVHELGYRDVSRRMAIADLEQRAAIKDRDVDGAPGDERSPVTWSITSFRDCWIWLLGTPGFPESRRGVGAPVRSLPSTQK